MTKSIRSKVASLLGVALVATSLGVAIFPGVASADTSAATAQAASGLLNSPIESRQGTSAGVSPDDDTPLPPNPLLNAGVLGQDTFVDRYGHSAACAGLVATSAQLNVLSGANGCANANSSTGVELNLIPGVLTLGLDGVYAQCTAGSNAKPTAGAFVLGNLRLELLGLGGATIPTPQPGVPTSVSQLTVLDPLLGLPISLNLPGVLELTIGETNIGTEKGSGASATALRLNLLGIRLEVGKVSCGPNLPEADTGQLVMDTSGDINVDNDAATNHVQDGTRNALTVQYTPAGDRTGTRANFIIDTNKLEFDTTDPAYQGCDAVGVNDPDTSCTFAGNGPNGSLLGGVPTSRTVPVRIKPGVTGTIDSSVTVSNGNEPGLDLTRTVSVPLRSETSTVVVQAGGNAPASGAPAGTQLPTNIPGALFVDVPHYVEYVEYDNEACTLKDNEVPPFAIPGLYEQGLSPAQRNLFDCGTSLGATSDFRLTVAPDAPTNVDGTGRIVIVRGPSSDVAPRIPQNTYTSDLVIDVTAGPPPSTPTIPDVTVDVTPDSRPAPGGDFTYKVVVKNTSTTTSATISGLSQKIRNNGGAFGAAAAVTGGTTCKVGTVIPASGSCTFDIDDALTGVTGDTETHQVNATFNGGNTDPTPGEDTAVLTNGRTLSVVKAAVDSIPFPGGEVTYTVTITNPNPVPVTIDSLKDKVGDAAPVTLEGDSDCKVGTVLNAAGSPSGTSCSFEFKLSVTGAIGTTHTDVVTVEVTPTGEPKFPTSSLPKTVTVSDPGPLDITLTADPTSLPEPGGKVKFTLSAKNLNPPAANGVNDLKITSLKVQYNPTVDASTMDESTCKLGETIKPAAAGQAPVPYTCTFTDDVLGNVGPITYTAIGIAETPAGKAYTDNGAATVTLTNVAPEIDVKLTVDPAARKTPGGDFTWTVTVTNTSKASSDPVTILGMKDDILGSKLADDVNCKKLIGVTLDVGKSASCSFVSKAEGPDGKVTNDLVVVNAEDDEDTPTSDFGIAGLSLTAADAPTTPTTTGPRKSMPVTGTNARTTAAAAMLFAGLGLVLKGGGMQAAPELALEGKRRRRR